MSRLNELHDVAAKQFTSELVWDFARPSLAHMTLKMGQALLCTDTEGDVYELHIRHHCGQRDIIRIKCKTREQALVKAEQIIVILYGAPEVMCNEAWTTSDGQLHTSTRPLKAEPLFFTCNRCNHRTAAHPRLVPTAIGEDPIRGVLCAMCVKFFRVVDGKVVMEDKQVTGPPEEKKPEYAVVFDECAGTRDTSTDMPNLVGIQKPVPGFEWWTVNNDVVAEAQLTGTVVGFDPAKADGSRTVTQVYGAPNDTPNAVKATSTSQFDTKSRSSQFSDTAMSMLGISKPLGDRRMFEISPPDARKPFFAYEKMGAAIVDVKAAVPIDPKRTAKIQLVVGNPFNEPQAPGAAFKFQVGRFAYACPGCTTVRIIPVDEPTHGWKCTAGSLDELNTLSLVPSLLCQKCGWHGFLAEGQFTHCEANTVATQKTKIERLEQQLDVIQDTLDHTVRRHNGND